MSNHIRIDIQETGYGVKGGGILERTDFGEAGNKSVRGRGIRSNLW